MTQKSNPDTVLPFDEPDREFHYRRKRFDKEIPAPPNSSEFDPFVDPDNQFFRQLSLRRIKRRKSHGNHRQHDHGGIHGQDTHRYRSWGGLTRH